MAILPILKYPDPRLATIAQPVTLVDERIRQLVDDMLETMYQADGVGLAATQVDVHEQVVVMDVSDERNEPLVMINPQIIWSSENSVLGEEGCLSVPQTYDKVMRHQQVRVRALGRDGRPYEFAAEGLLAVCVQHELDHLNGRVFVDYLSALKRSRIAARLLKAERGQRGKPSN